MPPLPSSRRVQKVNKKSASAKINNIAGKSGKARAQNQSTPSFPQPQKGQTARAIQNTNFYKDIVETIREPLIVLDSGLRVLFANRKFYSSFKVTAGKTIGKRIYDLGENQWDIPKLRTLLEEIIPEKNKFNNYQIEHDFPAIGKRIMLLNARRMVNPLEEQQLILLAIEDITDRALLEQALEESEERFRRAFETAQDGILLNNKTTGQVVNSNQAAQELLGYSLEELQKQKIWKFGFLKDAGQFQATVRGLKELGFVNLDDTTVKAKDGRHIPADVYFVDKTHLVQCNIRDISERKKQEDSLSVKENRFHELFNNIRSGVAVYEAVEDGRDFIFKDFNAAAEKIEKTPRANVIGRRVTEVFPGIREMTLLDAFRRVWKTGKAEHHPTTIYKDEHLLGWRENYVYKLPSGEIVAVYDDITERKLSEEKLANEGIRRRILIEQSRDGIVVLDTNGKVYESNLKFAEMLGYSLEEILDLHVWDWDFKLPKKEIVSMLQSADEAGDHFETQHKRKDGSVYDVEISANSSMFAGQKLIFTVCRDITERKRIEAQMRESEERFRTLYENATIGIYRTTPGGEILLANPALVKMLGYQSLEELTERNLNKDGFEPDYPRQEFQRQIEEGEVHGLESTWKRKDGSKIFVRESARVVRDKNGKVLYYEGTVEDISERHQAEKALKDNEIFLNSVIDNIPNMVFVKDVPDLRFVRFNKAGEELLGISSQSMYGKNDYDFFPPEEAQHFISKDKETLKNKLLLDIPEEKIQTKDQGERILHTKKIPILDQAGNPKYLLGISEDITERKQSEQALLILSDTQKQLAQADSFEELYQLVGIKLLELVTESYIVFSVLDEAQQATRTAGLFGFGPIYEKLKKTYKVDPSKYVYPQKDMTPEEARLFRSGRLEDFPGGLYALMARKIPKTICVAGEKQLKIKKIYTQGLINKGNYLGVVAILARGDISQFKEMIEIVIRQASITFDRIKSRKVMEESEERFRSLFEDSPVSLWEEDFSAVKQRLDALRARGVKDMHAYLETHPEEVSNCSALTRIINVNKAGVDLFKAKKKEELLKNLSKILSSQSLDDFRIELENIAEGKDNFSWEGVNLTLTGEVIYVSISWAAAPGHENDLSKVFVSIVDITDRKLAEEKIRYQASILANVNDAIIASDENYKISAWNKAAEFMYGWKAEEVLGHPGLEIIQTEYSDNDKQKMLQLINEMGKWRGEVIQERKNGVRFPVEVSSIVTKDEKGKIAGYVSVNRDITERKKAEEELNHLVAELRSLSEMEKKNRLFAEALAKNVIAINGTLKPDEILDSIIENINDVVPSDAINIMMIQGDHVRIVRASGYRERGLGEWEEQKQFGLNEIKTSREIIRSKKYRIISNTDKSKDWIATEENAWIKSNIISPILDGSRVIGFVNVDSATPDRYTEEHGQQLMTFTDQVSIALKNARLFEGTQRRMKRMQAMTQIDLAINSSLDINVSLEIVMIQAKDQLNADAVDILLVNKGTNALVFSKAKGFKTDEIRKSSFKLGTGLPGRAVLERTLIAIPDLTLASESYFRNMLVEREGFVSYYCIPLITKGELKGVMEVYFRQPFKADQEWQEFLEMLAQQAAIAINNAELLNSLKVSNADLMNAYENTLKGWVDALDMRDHETEGHTRRVAELALQLAKRMGVQDVDIVNFQRGALLHDIGKVAVPDAILNKPGPLTDEEWVIMRQHPLNALSLLSKSKYLLPALDIPYCHHEKWDGSGYPRGLKGEAIPLAARIFAVVDVWDALISDRPYRKAWTQKQALDHIQEQSGKHFDPKVVSAFLTLIKTAQVTPKA